MGGGARRAVPRYRHIGCVVSHGAAAVSCCVRVIGTCVTCVTCAGRATMTRRGGGRGAGRGAIGKCAAARAVTWVSSGDSFVVHGIKSFLRQELGSNRALVLLAENVQPAQRLNATSPPMTYPLSWLKYNNLLHTCLHRASDGCLLLPMTLCRLWKRYRMTHHLVRDAKTLSTGDHQPVKPEASICWLVTVCTSFASDIMSQGFGLCVVYGFLCLARQITVWRAHPPVGPSAGASALSARRAIRQLHHQVQEHPVSGAEFGTRGTRG